MTLRRDGSEEGICSDVQQLPLILFPGRPHWSGMELLEVFWIWEEGPAGELTIELRKRTRMALDYGGPRIKINSINSNDGFL